MWVFASAVTADMDEAEERHSNTDAKTRAKQQQIIAARQAVFNAYMQTEEESRPERRPTPGRFADPRAALQAGFTGR